MHFMSATDPARDSPIGFASTPWRCGARLPTIYGGREYVEAGASDVLRTKLAAPVPTRRQSYVDKILRGPKPADIPVEQPTKFELVINLEHRKGARHRQSRRRCLPVPTK